MFLNCHTYYSFNYGTLSPERLILEAERCGVHKLVLTEINNTTSYIEVLRLCRQNRSTLSSISSRGYKLSIAGGVEFRRGLELLYIAIAKNEQGFANINRFLSEVNIRKQALPQCAPALNDVVIIYPFGKVAPEKLNSDEYIGVRKNQLTRFTTYKERKGHDHKFVILHPVTFADKVDFNTHRLLLSIDQNTLISKLPKHLQAEEDEIMMPEPQLKKYFSAFPSLIENTQRIIDSCSLDITFGEDKNKKYFLNNKSEDISFLTEETWKGFKKRYGNVNTVLQERVERELRIIEQKDFCAYFLIAYDLVCYANRMGFDFVGRGSGANSIVAYCLGITNVDPIELNLYFERFLNPERSSPPDFDIDFSWDNRDAVYDYLFSKYGAEHTCLLGTHVTYQKRSVIRQLGKVFGLPKDEIDDLVQDPKNQKDRDHITALIYKYAERLKDMPSGMSIHAGGVLITEKPVFTYTALDLPPKNYPVSHIEMHNAEDIGLYKFDILSQRGLGHLKETVRLIKKNRGIDIDIHQFKKFKEDEKIKTLLRTGRTMGCFYVESPGMRMLLTKLRCEDYLTLVAASSIIRPGVASSGMMRTYIERYHLVRNGGHYESVHPLMDELMAETFGVMVYQEDVIKVAHHFAKLTLTEADVLRRGMSGKYRSREEFQQVRDRFFKNCVNEGYSERVIERVWYEIESFSGYSFAKGHSASYAVESYQSLYLKAHYPLEFMVGVINNFGGFYKTEFYFHEVRFSGARVVPPCVNNSEYLTTIVGDTVFTGFVHLKSLETKIARAIHIEREKNGLYTSLEDFLNRIPAGLEQTRILIRIGAFRFTGESKQTLLWEALLHDSHNKKVGNQSTPGLFNVPTKKHPLPSLERNPIEDAFDEMELLDFPLCDPFLMVDFSDYGTVTASTLKKNNGKRVSILGYVITTKDTYTKDKQVMHFGTFYDRHGEVFDTVHFPPAARSYPFRGRGFYFIQGVVTEDFGHYSIEVSSMEKIPFRSKLSG